MKYVFGPVPSRRLGRSLGIDPTPPPSLRGESAPGPEDLQRCAKICNWNCVYCQLGPTRPFTRKRASLFDPGELLSELRASLDRGLAGDVDWITFVGSGEPTLNRDLGAMIRGVRSLSDKPVAVITNGSLLGDPEVKRELLEADAVLPTLDAGSPALYRRINRPPSEYGYEGHERGLAEFRRSYKGKMWVELMLMKGLNDGEDALRDLAAALERIGPDQVHIVLPTRPPADAAVAPADADGLKRAEEILGSNLDVLMPEQGRGGFSSDADEGGVDALAAIIARHPMSEAQLRAALAGKSVADIDKAIASLVESGKAVVVDRLGTRFYRGS